jgi:hypothetical protein
MKQETCVLPVQCRRCSAVFDLWIDLQGLEQPDLVDFRGNGTISGAMKERYCWRCRQTISEEITDRRAMEVDEPEEIEEMLLDI